MMHDVVRDGAGRFIVVVSASVQISIEAREVTAGNLDANAMAGLEEIAPPVEKGFSMLTSAIKKKLVAHKKEAKKLARAASAKKKAKSKGKG